MKQHLGNQPAPQLSISDTYIWDFPPPASHRSPAGPAASLAASRLSQPAAAAMAPDSSEGLSQRAAGGRLVRRQLLSAPTGGRGRLGQLGADLLRGISPWGGGDRGVRPALSCQAPGQEGRKKCPCCSRETDWAHYQHRRNLGRGANRSFFAW